MLRQDILRRLLRELDALTERATLQPRARLQPVLFSAEPSQRQSLSMRHRYDTTHHLHTGRKQSTSTSADNERAARGVPPLGDAQGQQGRVPVPASAAEAGPAAADRRGK